MNTNTAFVFITFFYELYVYINLSIIQARLPKLTATKFVSYMYLGPTIIFYKRFLLKPLSIFSKLTVQFLVHKITQIFANTKC